MASDAWTKFYELRTLIHDEFYHFDIHELDSKHPDRNKFYGATDALHDTVEMLRGAKKLHKKCNESERKLVSYGILNAIYVQQDSVVRLSEVTSTKISVDGKIRTLRNRLAGHPAYAERNGGTSSIPARMEAGELSFQIYGLSDENKKDRFYKQDIDDLIDQNYSELNPMMEKIHLDLKPHLNLMLKEKSLNK